MISPDDFRHGVQRIRSEPMSRTVKVIIGFNGVVALIGFLVLFVSFYLRGKITSQGWSSVVGKNVATTGIVAGMMTLFLSFVGCIGAAAKKRALLCCYMTGFLIILIIQIVAAAGMVSYASSLKIRDEKIPSAQLTDASDIAINNAAFSAFLKCCSGCMWGKCNNTDPFAFVNTTLDNCLGPPVPTMSPTPLPPGSNATITPTPPPPRNATCQVMAPCGDSNPLPKCFVYPSWDPSPVVVPPISVDDRVCSTLASVWLNGAYIVSPAVVGGCGGGDPTAFLRTIDQFLSATIMGGAGFFIFVALIESIALGAGVTLLFCFRQHTVDLYDPDEDTYDFSRDVAQQQRQQQPEQQQKQPASREEREDEEDEASPDADEVVEDDGERKGKYGKVQMV